MCRHHKCSHRSEKSHVRGTNVYVGLGSDNGLDGNRRAKGNEYFYSHTVSNDSLKLKWKFDVAALFQTPTVGSRIIGPLGTPQVDETTVYFQTGANYSGFLVPDPEKTSYIVALHRDTGKLKWTRKYTDVSTEAQYMIAAKYPDQYNIPPGWKRTDEFVATFTPICVFDKFIITGDSTDSTEMHTQQYYSGAPPYNVPQANGGPVLGASWAVRNEFRQELRTSVFILDKETGAVVGADRFGDSGEPEAQGYCNVTCGLRMPTAYCDPTDGEYYVVTGCSITAVGADDYTIQSTIASEREIGRLNGNRRTTTSRLTLFHMSKEGKLAEKWRWYAQPRFLFHGDMNPYIYDVQDASGDGAVVTYTITCNARVGQKITVTGAGIYDVSEALVTGLVQTPPTATSGGGTVIAVTIDSAVVGAYAGGGKARFRFQEGDVDTNRLGDSAAEEYNNHLDGIWGQRPNIDFCRRQIFIASGNSKFSTIEDIQAGLLAPGTPNPATPGQDYPRLNYYGWNEIYKTQTSLADIQANYNIYYQSQRDRAANMKLTPGTRSQDFCHDALIALDMDSGKKNWMWQRVPLESWASVAGYVPADATGFKDLPLYLRWQFAGDNNDLEFGTSGVHVCNPEKNLDLYVAVGKDGSMQGLDPSDGDIMWNSKVAGDSASGGLNYGATTDEVSVYAVAQNDRTLSQVFGISTLNNNTILDEVQPGVYEPQMIPSTWPNDRQVLPFYSNTFVDNFNQLGGGAGKFYPNQNVEIPYDQGFIVKVDAATGVKLLDATVMAPDTAPVIPPDPVFYPTGVPIIYNGTITSVNDVIFSANMIGSELVAYDSSTLKRIWNYNAYDDVKDVPGYPADFLSCLVPIVPAGKQIFTGQGELGTLFSNTPGKWFYCFELKDKFCCEPKKCKPENHCESKKCDCEKRKERRHRKRC